MFYKRNSDAEQAIEYAMAKTPWLRSKLYNRTTDIRPIARRMINQWWTEVEGSTQPR